MQQRGQPSGQLLCWTPSLQTKRWHSTRLSQTHGLTRPAAGARRPQVGQCGCSRWLPARCNCCCMAWPGSLASWVQLLVCSRRVCLAANRALFPTPPVVVSSYVWGTRIGAHASAAVHVTRGVYAGSALPSLQVLRFEQVAARVTQAQPGDFPIHFAARLCIKVCLRPFCRGRSLALELVSTSVMLQASASRLGFQDKASGTPLESFQMSVHVQDDAGCDATLPLAHDLIQDTLGASLVYHTQLCRQHSRSPAPAPCRLQPSGHADHAHHRPAGHCPAAQGPPEVCAGQLQWGECQLHPMLSSSGELVLKVSAAACRSPRSACPRLSRLLSY